MKKSIGTSQTKISVLSAKNHFPKGKNSGNRIFTGAGSSSMIFDRGRKEHTLCIDQRLRNVSDSKNILILSNNALDRYGGLLSPLGNPLTDQSEVRGTLGLF